MFISSTNSPSFCAGKVKLIGFRFEDMSKNFLQINDLAKNHQLDLSIKKRSNEKLYQDVYSVVASKQLPGSNDVVYGSALSFVCKSLDKDSATLKMLYSVLDAMDKLKEKVS